MSIFFTRRGKAAELGPTLVEVSIEGSGNDYYSFVDIHGTTYTAAKSGIEVLTGDIITFTIAGSGYGYAEGKVVLDGTQVASSQNGTQCSYWWEVPAGITKVYIVMAYNSIGVGTITVTTSQ
jgi:hypothetical protein